MKKAFALACAGLLATGLAQAQTPPPAPAVVQAATPAATPASATPAAPVSAATLQALGAIKAANEEILRKQTETLQKLDDLQKAAEQLKIYSKRG